MSDEFGIVEQVRELKGQLSEMARQVNKIDNNVAVLIEQHKDWSTSVAQISNLQTKVTALETELSVEKESRKSRETLIFALLGIGMPVFTLLASFIFQVLSK